MVANHISGARARIAACAVGWALVACSGDPGTPIADAPSSSGTGGTGGTGDGGDADAGPGGTAGGTVTVEACVRACEVKHPAGAALSRAIDTCWARRCSDECDGIGAGQLKPPDEGSCDKPVTTPSTDCSQCTVDECCTAWDACFGNADCSALNTCSIACYR